MVGASAAGSAFATATAASASDGLFWQPLFQEMWKTWGLMVDGEKTCINIYDGICMYLLYYVWIYKVAKGIDFTNRLWRLTVWSHPVLASCSSNFAFLAVPEQPGTSSTISQREIQRSLWPPTRYKNIMKKELGPKTIFTPCQPKLVKSTPTANDVT